MKNNVYKYLIHFSCVNVPRNPRRYNNKKNINRGMHTPTELDTLSFLLIRQIAPRKSLKGK